MKEWYRVTGKKASQTVDAITTKQQETEGPEKREFGSLNFCITLP